MKTKIITLTVIALVSCQTKKPISKSTSYTPFHEGDCVVETYIDKDTAVYKVKATNGMLRVVKHWPVRTK